jgi:putative ubiquitin-RnfH superfamily antitoxin RatB of RatAB toxin-antitoxin module
MAEQPAFVEVLYATADEQRIVRVAWEPGLTARGAVERSGLLGSLPQAISAHLVLGIYGVRVELERLLVAGDRVEICRPLAADPREQRRSLAARGDTMGSRRN